MTSDSPDIVYSEDCTIADDNRWIELLSTRQLAFDRAPGLRAGWRYLLSVSQQVQLLLARVRGQFIYRGYRRLALWSLLRPMLYISLIAGLGLAIDYGLQARQARADRTLLNALDASNHDRGVLHIERADPWHKLARASDTTKHNIVAALASGGGVPAVSKHTEILAHALVGLDPTGARSAAFVRRHVLRAIGDADGLVDVKSDMIALAAWLRLDSALAQQVMDAAVEAMEPMGEHDRRQIAEALAHLYRHHPSVDIRPVFSEFVDQRILPPFESHGFRRKALGLVVGRLGSDDLDLAVPLALAEVLSGRHKGHPWSEVLWRDRESPFAHALGEALIDHALGTDTPTLAKQAERMQRVLYRLPRRAHDDRLTALTERLEVETDAHVREVLLALLETYEPEQAERKRALAKVAQIVRPDRSVDIDKPRSRGDYRYQARRLRDSAHHLQADELRPVLTRVANDIRAVISELSGPDAGVDEARELDSLAELFGELTGHLERSEILPVATSIVAHLQQAPTSEWDETGYYWGELAQALIPLSARARLTERELAPVLQSLRERVNSAIERNEQSPIASTLIELSQNIGPEQARAAAQLCLHGLRTVNYPMAPLDYAADLKRAIEQLTAEERQTVARALLSLAVDLVHSGAAVADRRAHGFEGVLTAGHKGTAEFFRLQQLRRLLPAFASALPSQEFSPLVTLISEYMATAPPGFLPELSDLLAVLTMTEPERAPSAVTKDDIRPAIEALLERISGPRACTDPLELCRFVSEATLGLQTSQPADLAARAADLWARVVVAVPSRIGYASKAWVHVHGLAPAGTLAERVQAHIELLRSPYVVGFSRTYLLQNLEQLTGESFFIRKDADTPLWRFLAWAESSGLDLQL